MIFKNSKKLKAVLILKLLSAFVTVAFIGNATAQQKTLVEKWLDGEVKANYPKVTYSGPPITLKYSTFVAPGTPMAKVQQRTFDRLKADTNGKIVVQPYWGSSLANAQRGAFDAISQGIADFGTCYVLFNSGGFKLFQGLQLPYIFENSLQSSSTAEELYPKYLKKEYEARDVYLLHVSTTQPQQILTQKRQILKLEDMKGQKVWAPGSLSQEIAQALGASPTSVQSSEIYTAFQSGVVDAVPMHDAGTKLFRLIELAKYRTVANLWINPTEYCLNKKAWAGLPSDLKGVFYHWAQLANTAEAQLYYDRESVDALKDMDAKGIKSVTLSPEEIARWAKVSEPVVQNFIKTHSADGLPAKAFYEEMVALQKKYKKMTPDEVTQALLDKPISGIIDF
jgi:TRAP-type C4-dicarboxylate transport system substrate-binding protein